MSVLVTGGTGKLGRPTVARLRETGYDVRVLSRRHGVDHAVADLDTGVGLDEATSGVTTVVHAATGGDDLSQTRRLVNALQRRPTPAPHLVYVSIVGVDANPMRYYATKFACEKLVAASGLGWTIIRVTQFHDLVAGLFEAQRRLPVLGVIDASVQPVDIGDVVPRMVELVEAGPSGRVPDVGGPQQRSFADLARSWQHAYGGHKPVVNLPIPGKAARALRAGAQLATLPGYGTTTFEDFLNRRA